MRILVIIIAVIFVMPVYGQRKKKSDEEIGSDFNSGILYSLPRTGLRVKVKAAKEIFEPGPYAAYASQLLGIEGAYTQGFVKWTIAEISADTYSEPDPQQIYKASGDIAVMVTLSENGCLSGVNTKSKEEENNSLRVSSYINPYKEKDEFLFSDFNDSPVFLPGDSTNNYRPVRVAPEIKAAEAAERILECRLTKFHMVAGLMDEFHPDGVAYKESLKELDNIEKGYMSLFTGRSSYEYQTYCFNYIPTDLANRGEVILRFSEEKGVLPVSDLSGKPVLVRVTTENRINKELKELISPESDIKGTNGIYYRIPVMADINIIYELKTIANIRALLPQFGVVAPVPEKLLQGEYYIDFYEKTGALKSVKRK